VSSYLVRAICVGCTRRTSRCRIPTASRSPAQRLDSDESQLRLSEGESGGLSLEAAVPADRRPLELLRPHLRKQLEVLGEDEQRRVPISRRASSARKRLPCLPVRVKSPDAEP